MKCWGLLPLWPYSCLPSDQLAYSCFSHLMKRMSQNFPNGGAMDTHFANMRSLIQVRSVTALGHSTGTAGLVHRPLGGYLQRLRSIPKMSFMYKLNLFHLKNALFSFYF